MAQPRTSGVSTVELYSVIAGAFTLLTSFPLTLLVGGSTHTLKMTYASASVQAFFDGASVGTFTLTGGAAAIAGTSCGVRNGNAVSTIRWDNYQVTA